MKGGGKVVTFPQPSAEGPIELPEGKNLGNTILHGIARARRERRKVVVIRSYRTSAGKERKKAIVYISPQGDVSEPRVATFTMSLGARVMEQLINEGTTNSAAGRLIKAHLHQAKVA